MTTIRARAPHATRWITPGDNQMGSIVMIVHPRASGSLWLLSRLCEVDRALEVHASTLADDVGQGPAKQRGRREFAPRRGEVLQVRAVAHLAQHVPDVRIVAGRGVCSLRPGYRH